MSSSSPPSFLENQLLAALPKESQQRLFPFMTLVDLPLGKVLREPGAATPRVFFPTDSIVTLLQVMENGAPGKILMVGNEGLIGLAAFMGGESNLGRVIVQSAGSAFALPSPLLRSEFNSSPDVRMLMLLYVQTLFALVAQTAVCNRHHSIKQQLCRWFLLSLDRLPGNHLIMTQELIATMLGVRREGVTEAAGKLQAAGVIEYHRGKITILNRPLLEKLSCECYVVVKKETARLGTYRPRHGVH